MKKLGVIGLILVLLLAGCGSNDSFQSEKTSMDYATSEAPMAEPKMMEKAEMAMEEAGYDDEAAGEFTNDMDGNGQESQTVYERKIIKTGFVYMETLEYDETLNTLKMLIEKYNAYTAFSQNTGGGMYESNAYQRSSRFTIKVPAEFFESMYEELQTVGHVLNANEGKEDITSQFVDIESRLTTLYVQEERLLSILEKSENLEDIIELEYALQDVRYEIESYTTSLRNLEDLVRFSTIDVNVQEVYEETEVKKPVITFGDRISNGLSETFKEIKEGIQDLIVFIIVEFPYLIVTGIVIFVAVKIFRKSAKKSKLNEATKKVAEEPVEKE